MIKISPQLRLTSDSLRGFSEPGWRPPETKTQTAVPAVMFTAWKHSMKCGLRYASSFCCTTRGLGITTTIWYIIWYILPSPFMCIPCIYHSVLDYYKKASSLRPSPDLNLTPLAAFLRFCRAQRGQIVTCPWECSRCDAKICRTRIIQCQQQFCPRVMHRQKA